MKRFALLLCGLCFALLTYGQQVRVIKDHKSINTIQQMLAPFKGKPVFVDMWATWCYACLDEFKFNSQLDSCLNKNHIALLYISLDKDELDSTWNSDMNRLKLYGYHIRANQSLQNELTTLIWGAPGGFSIPHYLLFDKDGKLLNKDTMPPSSTKGLYGQLESLLK